jgi:hypothetical protein
MATFEASQARAVAIELRENVLDLYVSLLPLYRGTGAWALNDYDPLLPTPIELRTQLAAYRALTLPTLLLVGWGEQFLTASADDTLTYPTPPSGWPLTFDENIIFSETLIF